MLCFARIKSVSNSTREKTLDFYGIQKFEFGDVFVEPVAGSVAVDDAMRFGSLRLA